MAQKTKQQLKDTLVNGHLVTGGDFTDLVDSLKGVQSPVSSPSASGNATAFIDSISQDAEGSITVTKKNVNFSGYQTVAGMQTYQDNDLQKTGSMNVDGTETDISTSVEHNMRHYPTVRLIGDNNVELRPTSLCLEPYTVEHASENRVIITLNRYYNVNGNSFTYILD